MFISVCVEGGEYVYACLFAGDPVGASYSYVHEVMIFDTLLL